MRQFAAKVSVPVEIDRITVKTDDDAQRFQFIGSPTVRVNGLDVEPSARNLTQYGFT